MRDVIRIDRALSGRIAVLILAAFGLLGACAPQQDAGFDKVGFRSAAPIARPVMPDPPPVTVGLAGPAAPGPVVAANLPEGVTQEMVEEGQRLYGTVCVACHAAGGVGGPVGPALNDQDWLHISGAYEEIVTIVNTGVPQPRQFPAPMPPRGGGSYTDDQVRAIAAYVYAISQPSTP